MKRKREKRRGRHAVRNEPKRPSQLSAADIERQMRVKQRFLTSAMVLLTCAAAVWGMAVLERRAAHDPRFQDPPILQFSGDVADGLKDKLVEHLGDLVQQPWRSETLCSRLGQRLEESAWVRQVRSVQRRGDGIVILDCDYRRPIAVVQDGGNFILVADDGMRLPGRYGTNADLPIIQGSLGPAPWVGEKFGNGDVTAAIDVLRRISDQPFRGQVLAVRVDNFQGRIDPTASHLELVTDQAGGRILWGSAPGTEVEENIVEQKLAILRYNFETSGRVDAFYPVIDISTFPDRFIVPGGA